MENRKIQFRSKACTLHLSAYPGHFATKHSHVNYFLDMTTLKVRQSNAEEAARALVPLYKIIPSSIPSYVLTEQK